jgi:hypothetical protein
MFYSWQAGAERNGFVGIGDSYAILSPVGFPVCMFWLALCLLVQRQLNHRLGLVGTAAEPSASLYVAECSDNK